jgi:hypothetical protein
MPEAEPGKGAHVSRSQRIANDICRDHQTLELDRLSCATKWRATYAQNALSAFVLREVPLSETSVEGILCRGLCSVDKLCDYGGV